MANVHLDELASAVMAELEEYAQYTAEALKESVKEAGTAVQDHLHSNSPRDSGDYAKSWTVKVTEMPHGSKVLVHSRNRYQLTHLLEYGHAKRGGGRVAAQPHIAAAQTVGEEVLNQELQRRLSNG